MLMKVLKANGTKKVVNPYLAEALIMSPDVLEAHHWRILPKRIHLGRQ